MLNLPASIPGAKMLGVLTQILYCVHQRMVESEDMLPLVQGST